MINNKIFKNKSNKVKIISLIGMMGSGKSKFGSFLSKKLDYKFYDIDNLIEQRFNKTITEIFESHGEDIFRDEEKKIIQSVIFAIIQNNKNSVVSLGGGGFDNLETQNLLLSNSFVVWLNCPLEVLSKRIGDGKKRPMLKNDAKKTLQSLYEKRVFYYQKAHLILDTSRTSFNEMTKKILRKYK